MYTTKTGIKIPEGHDKCKGLHDMVHQLYDIIVSMASVIDQLSEEIEKLKRGITIYASEDTDTDT